MEEIKIRDEFIKLGQLLKLADMVQDGVEAKYVITDGLVKVNGEVDDRRGRKVYEGDIVSYDGKEIKDRDNSRSCSQIQSSLTLFYFCKAGKKNCIHPKTEFIRILYHIISVLKIIYTFIIFYQLISHLIWNLLFYLPDFQVLLILFQRL